MRKPLLNCWSELSMRLLKHYMLLLLRLVVPKMEVPTAENTRHRHRGPRVGINMKIFFLRTSFHSGGTMQASMEEAANSSTWL